MGGDVNSAVWLRKYIDLWSCDILSGNYKTTDCKQNGMVSLSFILYVKYFLVEIESPWSTVYGAGVFCKHDGKLSTSSLKIFTDTG